MNRLLPIGLLVFLLAVLAGAGLYVYSHPSFIEHFSLTKPCSAPIPYRIGTVDARFGLTASEIETKLKAASDLWNGAEGKTLFTYAPSDPKAMPVNFVYDTRQETVSLGNKINTVEGEQNSERTQIETLQSQYQAAEAAYAGAVDAFNSKSEAYAKEVEAVNAQGGADPATYARLKTEQQDLKSQQAALEKQGSDLEAMAAALQQKIDSFNANVHDINQVVNDFNANSGNDFEEGQYVRDASGHQHIDIYAFKNESELEHSLAHELGHALGLSHNQNPASIMFPYNKSSTRLSADDVAALKNLCGS